MHEMFVHTRQSLTALQDIVDILNHDSLHILQFVVDVVDVSARSRVGVRFLRLLNVRGWIRKKLCELIN